MEISDSDSVVVQVEEQTELASQLNHKSTLMPLNVTSNDDKTRTDRWLNTAEPPQIASAPLEDAHVSATLQPSLQLEKGAEEKEAGEDDEDFQLMVSAEAQQLAEEILQHSFSSLNGSGYSTDSRHKENASPQASNTATQPSLREQHKIGEKLRNEISCQTVASPPVQGEQPSSQPHSPTTRDTQTLKEIKQPQYLDTQIPNKMEQDQSSSKPRHLQESNDKSVAEDTVATRSGSTIFVDLARLQESPPTDWWIVVLEQYHICSDYRDQTKFKHSRFDTYSHYFNI